MSVLSECPSDVVGQFLRAAAGPFGEILTNQSLFTDSISCSGLQGIQEVTGSGNR